MNKGGKTAVILVAVLVVVFVLRLATNLLRDSQSRDPGRLLGPGDLRDIELNSFRGHATELARSREEAV